jgi:hypothetical protein
MPYNMRIAKCIAANLALGVTFIYAEDAAVVDSPSQMSVASLAEVISRRANVTVLLDDQVARQQVTLKV